MSLCVYLWQLSCPYANTLTMQHARTTRYPISLMFFILNSIASGCLCMLVSNRTRDSQANILVKPDSGQIIQSFILLYDTQIHVYMGSSLLCLHPKKYLFSICRIPNHTSVSLKLCKDGCAGK